jgi:hypothetical protein
VNFQAQPPSGFLIIKLLSHPGTINMVGKLNFGFHPSREPMPIPPEMIWMSYYRKAKNNLSAGKYRPKSINRLL